MSADFISTGVDAEQKSRKWPDSKECDRWIRRFLHKKRAHGPVVFLDSQLAGHAASTDSYIACDPVCAITSHNGRVTVESKHKTEPSSPSSLNPWEALKKFREDHPDWMFGWLGYDLKNDIEDLTSRNPDPVGLPDMYFFVPGVLIRIKRDTNRAEIIKGDGSELDDIPFDSTYPEPDSGTQNDPLHRSSQGMSRDKSQNCRFDFGPLESGEGWEAYRGKIQEIKALIARGETYEVNFTHQLSAECSGDSLDLFDAMKDSGPVPFAAWVSYGDVDVCCASPERFLNRDGTRVCSQPIKGTSPRGSNPQEDEKIVNEILKKEKNRAENVMIVDLVRHDLGQVASTGSVRTDALLEVQTFSTVHQLVSTVSAEVSSRTCSVDVLKACFPMGSMTGAPKIRTMQIIEVLERYRRGLYSGAIGYFTPKDDFSFNVVIRTAIITRGRLFYPVGGAITSDSDPREEWEESWLKARALQHKQGK